MIRSFRFVALAIVCIVCLTRPTTAQDAAPSVSPSPPSGFVSRSVSVDGRNVHVLVGGHGAPIMLLHGWPETSYAWHVVAPQLARTRMVIVPDLPGLGDSDSPTGGYDTRNIARILHAMVVQLGVSRIDLVGHDVGMWVAYRYAVDYGASIRRLVLMDAALPGIGAEPPKTRASNMKSFQFALNAVPELPEQLVAGRDQTFLDWFFHNKSVQTAAVMRDAPVFVAAYARPGHETAGFAYYRAVFNTPVNDTELNKASSTTKLQMPVLALGGASGEGPAVLAAAHIVATNVSGGVIPDSGHYIEEEQPTTLFRKLQAFLR